MSHIQAIFSSPLANDETARDPLETDGNSPDMRKKEESRLGGAGSLIIGRTYCGDVAKATGCKLREMILVPITSPETTNSTRRFC